MPFLRLRSLATVTPLVAIGLVALAGCGTTRSSDSLRTATEQLLISDAIDRAVQTIDFQPLASQSVFLDDVRLKEVVDREYLVSTLRQHLLASGCTIKDNRDEADFIVEVRAGAVGTDRNDLLFGIPATNVPQIVPLQGVPSAIPEVPLAKRRDQRGVAKISMFAYHRETGKPVWQSGVAARESSSNDVWLFGAGPFQYGSILKERPDMPGTGIATTERDAETHEQGKHVRLTQRALFASPSKLAKQQRRLPATTEVAATEVEATDVAGAASEKTKDAAANPVATAKGEQSLPSFTPASLSAKALIPGLAEAASPKKRVVPRLTGGITEEDLLRNIAPKTVELNGSAPQSDPLALPQPRFDSL